MSRRGTGATTRVTVCELTADPSAQGDAGDLLERQWAALLAHASETRPQLVVLPEMPFGPWLPASRPVDPRAWDALVEAHDRWLDRLHELGGATVASSRPVVDGSRRYNEAFVWDPHAGYRAAHRKTYLPDEPGFWEASWYDRGPTVFEPVTTPAGRLGFLVCTELWFLEHARRYGAGGIDLLVCPRGTPRSSLDRWLAAGRVAGVCAGAYCLSSNRAGEAGGTPFAGTGWVTEPEGAVLATTAPDRPFVTVEVDLEAAADAKSTHPRYVDTSPVGAAG